MEAVLPIILLCAGAAVALLSAAALWQRVKLYVRGQHVTGALIGWRYTFDQKWLRSGHKVVTRCYYPIVRFEAADGSQHRVESAVGYEAKPDWPIGRPFPVRYDRTSPRDATADPASRAWIAPALSLIVGAALLYAGIHLALR